MDRLRNLDAILMIGGGFLMAVGLLSAATGNVLVGARALVAGFVMGLVGTLLELVRAYRNWRRD